jgi:hypothetical protein
MRLMALHKRATADGVDAAAVEAAMDADEPKKELTALLLEKHAAVASEDEGGTQALLEELQGLKLMVLYGRGSDAGVAAVLLDDAMDSDEPKAALIELIVKQPAPSKKGGSTPPPQPQPKLPLEEVGREIKAAALNGDAARLAELLSHSDIAEVDLEATTALYHGASSGHDEVVRLLATAGASVDAPCAVTSFTPLHVAAQRGHLSVVSVLLEKGAEVSLQNSKGKTAHDLARIKKHQDVMDLLQSALRMAAIGEASDGL